MVDVIEFKNKIEQLLSQEYKVEFLGKNFEKTVNLLTEVKANKIYNWINAVVAKKIQPILVGTKKQIVLEKGKRRRKKK